MTDALQQTVAALTTALLWPVVVLLLVGVGHAAFLAGEALVEAWGRRGPARRLVLAPGGGAAAAGPGPGRRGVAAWVAARADEPGASPWLCLDRAEAALAARVDRARLWVRLGPALGLAGTLIPLGPALTALARQDLALLADRLVLAFGTTVLGLVAGGVAFVVASAQDRWYRLDLAEVRHALEEADAAADGAVGGDAGAAAPGPAGAAPEAVAPAAPAGAT